MRAVTSKVPSFSSSSGSGASHINGRVLSVIDNVARVRLALGNKEVQVRTDVMQAKGISPKAGENWVFHQPYGTGWMFAAIIGYPGMDALTWVAPTLLGSWSNSSSGTWTESNGVYAPAGYLREDDGWVVLRGTVTGPQSANSNAPGPINADIFQLPEGARPSLDGQLRFTTVVQTGASGVVMVRPDGFVRAISGNPALTSLDGIRFVAGG
jgi:hypothetical protein